LFTKWEQREGLVRLSWKATYVATGEVTTLEHELGDDTVEGRSLVALALGLGAELSEVLGGLGDNVVVELEVNTALGGWMGGKQQLAELNLGILVRDYRWIGRKDSDLRALEMDSKGCWEIRVCRLGERGGGWRGKNRGGDESREGLTGAGLAVLDDEESGRHDG
jgi:hypothetical protein